MPFFRKPEPTVIAEFQDAPLRSAIQIIAESVNAQFSIGPEVGGVINLRRTQLPLRQLLKLVISQVAGAFEVLEENNVFVFRGNGGKPGDMSQLQQQIATVESNARKKLARLPSGTVLYRMSGYVKTNNTLQSLLEIGAPPSSHIVIGKAQQKVSPEVSSTSMPELTVVRLTEKDTWLQAETGVPFRAPLAGFRFYQP